MTLLWHPTSSKLDVLMKVTNADTVLAFVRVNAQRNWRSVTFSKLFQQKVQCHLGRTLFVHHVA
jgi:hypothetical protein